MNARTEEALRQLANLGFTGRDVYLAELIPVVEMAWADGEVQPNEKAMLEAYCEELTRCLNKQARAPLFSLGRARQVLNGLLQRRLWPHERHAALRALQALSLRGTHGMLMRRRMFDWAEAVAAVAGSPVWDTRELFWLQAMKRNFEPIA